MTLEGEAALLENVLDALDRLFDRDSSTWDVWALLTATAAALGGTPHAVEFAQPVEHLAALLRSAPLPETEREQALTITDPLRQYLARILPHPAARPG